MNETDRPAIVTVAIMAALADGQQGPGELTRVKEVATRLGAIDFDTVARQVGLGQLHLADVVKQLSDDEARRAAYETALAVCNADTSANEAEQRFLAELKTALGLDAAAVEAAERNAALLAARGADAAPVEVGTGTPPGDAGLDDLILKQAMLTGAVEILPDGIANIAILPLQLRLVYTIGQRYGQQLDANQVKDLAGTLGIGAAAQVVEGVVRKVLGGVTGGLLGGLLGGATGLAAGAAVTFSTTYALGHVAKQYYAQGRRLSAADLKALFARFQEEAKALFPKLQGQVQAQAGNLNVQSLMSAIRGT